MTQSAEFLAPVSLGEAFDKITILKIKRQMIKDPGKLNNVSNELSTLERSLALHVKKVPAEVSLLVDKLHNINKSLWDIEDDIRDCERRKDFGIRFIELARAVYVTNDERAAVKKQINVRLGSSLIEEKSYQEYNLPQG